MPKSDKFECLTQCKIFKAMTSRYFNKSGWKTVPLANLLHAQPKEREILITVNLEIQCYSSLFRRLIHVIILKCKI